MSDSKGSTGARLPQRTGIPMRSGSIEVLVERLVGPAEPFGPGRRLTSLGSWFATRDGGTLVLAVGPEAAVDDAATATAYALAWQQDRDLVLIVPASAADSVAARLAYVATPVRLWAVDSDLSVRAVPIPSVEDVVSEARERPLRRGEAHDLGERAAWVAGLRTGVDGHWALVPAHRGSYLSWHCAGRQVLRLSRQRNGVLLQAGVQYKSPPPDRPPYVQTLTEALTDIQRARAEAAIALAVADRLSGRDSTHVEHQMQAALAARELRDLGLLQFAREYPAWRGDGAPGYIDFLGVDRTGQLHIVETKIGSDPMLVFQALDYVTWVRAHATEIRYDLGWPDGDNSVVHMDLVVAPKTTGGRSEPAIGPYTLGQLEALAEDVAWQVHLIGDATGEVPAVLSLPPGAMPEPQSGVVAQPVAPARSGHGPAAPA